MTEQEIMLVCRQKILSEVGRLNDIPNVENKSAARRLIERVFRKPFVREIPDLPRKLGLYDE
jgi:hypothetical protein